MKRKLLSAALLLVMLLTVVPAVSAADSGAVDYLNINFNAATNTDKLTAGTIGTAITGASLNDTKSLFNDSEKTYAQLVTDSTDTSRGKFLKVYNNSASTDAVSITIPFSSTYTASGNELLIWEMDYKLLSTTGTHYFFMNLLDSNSAVSLDFQKMNAKGFRFKDASNVIYKTFNTANDTWVHQKTVIDVKGGTNGTGEILSVSYTVDGTTNEVALDPNITPNLKANAGAIELFLTLSNDTSFQEYYVDNLHIYSVPKMAIASSSVDSVDAVTVDSDVIVTFTNAITDTSALATVITAGGSLVDEGSYTVTPSADKKTVTISFTEDMEYGAAYSITFSGAVDANGLELNGSVNFNTEAAPDITVEDVTIYKGAGEGAVAPAQLVADGNLQSVAISLQNNTAESKNALLMFAVYNSSNRLTAVSYASTALAGSESVDVIQGLKIPVADSGGYVKVFVWNQLTALNPYVSPVTLAIQ